VACSAYLNGEYRYRADPDKVVEAVRAVVTGSKPYVPDPMR
jgi:hypothetical protein